MVGNRFANFSQGENSGKQNPYFGQNMYNYGQVQNPYVPPVPPQQNNTISRSNLAGLRGRVVGTPEEIAPSEIPTDGNPSIFPLADGSSIIVKWWGQDALPQTSVYLPVPSPTSPAPDVVNPTDDIWTKVMDRLDKIEKLVKKNAYRKPYSKKEGNDNAE